MLNRLAPLTSHDLSGGDHHRRSVPETALSVQLIPRDRGSEWIDAYNNEVQQPHRTSPTASNLYHHPPRA
jgi:hypothetical protein